MTIDAALEEIKKAVIDKPGFVSIGIGKDVTDREAIIITRENSSGIHYLDIPVSVDGYNVIIKSSSIRAQPLKRTTHIDLRRYL